jgi:hypothetical protein
LIHHETLPTRNFFHWRCSSRIVFKGFLLAAQGGTDIDRVSTITKAATVKQQRAPPTLKFVILTRRSTTSPLFQGKDLTSQAGDKIVVALPTTKKFILVVPFICC